VHMDTHTQRSTLVFVHVCTSVCAWEGKALVSLPEAEGHHGLTGLSSGLGTSYFVVVVGELPFKAL
jgi:hypothetical protein